MVDTRREEEKLHWGGFGTCANTPCLHLHNWIIVTISIEIITISINKHHDQQHVPTVLAQHTLLTLLTQLDHLHQKYIIVNMTLSDSTIYIILHSTNFNPCEQTSWPCNENWEIG